MIKTAVVRSFFVSEELMPDINTQNKKLDKIQGGGYTFSIKKWGKFLNAKKPHVLYRLCKTGENRPVFAVIFSVFHSMIFNSTLFIAIQLLVEPHRLQPTV